MSLQDGGCISRTAPVFQSLGLVLKWEDMSGFPSWFHWQQLDKTLVASKTRTCIHIKEREREREKERDIYIYTDMYTRRSFLFVGRGGHLFEDKLRRMAAPRRLIRSPACAVPLKATARSTSKPSPDLPNHWRKCRKKRKHREPKNGCGSNLKSQGYAGSSL